MAVAPTPAPIHRPAIETSTTTRLASRRFFQVPRLLTNQMMTAIHVAAINPKANR